MNEAERSFVHFVEIVNQKRPLEDLSQLIINASKKRLYFSSQSLPQEEDLNIIPAFELMNIEEILKTNLKT